MEIERKFLIDKLPFNLSLFKRIIMKQCYISISPTIRIRMEDNNFMLSIKGSGSIAREEFELKLTAKQYENLLKKSETKLVEKTRYLIPLDNGLIAELDVYEKELEGFFSVEVEFESLEDANNFKAPSWFGKDVSEDITYKNSHLAMNGLPKNFLN